MNRRDERARGKEGERDDCLAHDVRGCVSCAPHKKVDEIDRCMSRLARFSCADIALAIISGLFRRSLCRFRTKGEGLAYSTGKDTDVTMALKIPFLLVEVASC